MGREGSHVGVHLAVQFFPAGILDFFGTAVRYDDPVAVRAVHRDGSGAQGHQQPAGADVLPECARRAAVLGGADEAADGTVPRGMFQ